MSKLSKTEEKGLLAQLKASFGSKKAKELVKQIKQIKRDNPNTYYHFVFGENGELTAIEKEV